MCGGKLKIIAVIEQPDVIERIPTHIGLSAQLPPRALARRVDLFQALDRRTRTGFVQGWRGGSAGAREQVAAGRKSAAGQSFVGKIFRG